MLGNVVIGALSVNPLAMIECMYCIRDGGFDLSSRPRVLFQHERPNPNPSPSLVARCRSAVGSVGSGSGPLVVCVLLHVGANIPRSFVRLARAALVYI